MPGRPPTLNYTCRDYRLEMMLLGLEKQLRNPDTPDDQKKALEAETQRLRQQLGMD